MPAICKVFIDEPQISALEERMAEKGYLDGAKMANVFNMLRPNDLIWSFVVNNYIRGKSPMPFDLLTWNSDATRMTPACHSFYLRNCYLENKLRQRRNGDRRRDSRLVGCDKCRSIISRRERTTSRRHARSSPARSCFGGDCALRARRAPATSPASSTRRRSRNINIGRADSSREPMGIG